MREFKKRKEIFDKLWTQHEDILQKYEDENIDPTKLSPKELLCLVKLKLIDVSVKIPTAKRDLLPLWEQYRLNDKPVMLLEEFMLLKMSKETYDRCLIDFAEIT